MTGTRNIAKNAHRSALPALLLATLLSAALTSACVTKRARTAQDAETLKLRDKNPSLTMAEVSEDQPLPKRKRAKRRPSPTTASEPTADLSPAQIQSCQTALNQLQPAAKSLYALLPAGSYAPTGSAMDALLAADVSACADPARRQATLNVVAEAVSQHGGRIGVILPLSGPRAPVAAYLVKGMRAAFQEAGLNFDQVAVLKDSGGDARTAEARLAELVFRDKPTLIIGGLESQEAEMLSRRGTELLLPTLLLNRDRTLTQRSPYLFSVYPDEKRLADSLVETAKRRGFKRFAVLRPTGGKADKVSDYFRGAVVAGGGRIVHDLVYTPGNFDSMQGVTRQLFKTEAADRIDEYRTAYRRARQRAQQEHVAFDPRMVILKPIVEFDAVFVPDDFRTARHFAKLFKFHMVDKLPMIGNHEWRSPALIDPFDEFLDGSFFADFVGSYTKLPPAISAPTIGSPYFVQPQNVAAVDFQLIGYRIARIARQTLAKAPTSRRQIPDALAQQAGDGDAAGFGRGKVFGADRQSAWPTYVFSISKGQLVLDAPALAASR